MSCFCIHPEKTRNKRKREHKSGKHRKVFYGRVCFEFEDTFESIFHRVDIFLDDENLAVNFIKFIFKVFEIGLDFISEHCRHTYPYQF